ncbi:LCP family protein required for cell wall assembly [Agromyces hippuratus]|uniref:LCP family protein required for cell wall assembly n=1 Tax=Agromyces hippuratus TaxID=286438 RepID=A0A852WWM2_9MICO|nr:LCP family protein [Agromyces hippuratus]NYG22037.1 LCP family protein required for cell wall assembly [Agromyces hippuratus]
MAEELRSSARRAASSTPVVRHGRLKRRSIWRTLAKVTATLVAVTLVSGVSVAAYAAWDLANTAQPSITLGNEDVLEGVPDVGAIDGGVNLLLIGSDSREGQGDGFGDPDEETAVLNDVTMLLHISEDHTNASVISFPRDMLVDVPACVDPADPAGDPLYEQYGVKMNSVLSLGGMPCVVKTVEQLVGVSIPFAGTVQFLGVAGLSEAVGGVPVCIAEPIEDEHTDLYLPAGTQELSGMEALQFLRTRHGVGDGSDLGRISNQQVFMSALARTLQSNGTLSDPVKLYGIAKAALANMQLSDSLMDPTTMISIASALKDTDLSKIAFVQYPTGYSDGDLIPSGSAEIVNTALQNDMPVAFDPEADEAAFASAGDPTAVDAAPAPEAEAPAEEEAPATADGATPPPTVEALPSDVTGQTAAETRCSAGRTLDDQ